MAVAGHPQLSGSHRTLTLTELARVYRRDGESVFSNLLGQFAIAIYDRSKHKLLLGIDRMGVERITYRRQGDGIIFGNDARWVAGADASISDQRLFDFVFFHMIPSPNTVFQSVHKLPPASMLVLQHDNITIRRYWRPSYEYDADTLKLRQELLVHLESAVRSTCPDSDSGAFLSGGLDSSTIAGFLSKLSNDVAKTFSIGFDVDGYNELPYARIANQHFGCKGHEYEVTAEDIITTFSKIAAAS